MTPQQPPLDLARWGARLERIGAAVTHYGLALVIAWIGGMKFTTYEAEGIEPLVRNSPLMSWCYSVLSVTGFSACLGTVEIMVAGLIAARLLSPWASALGGVLASFMFLTTLSFLLSTPGAFEPSLGGFPALSGSPGQFLLKDIVLLGAALSVAGSSLLQTQTAHRARNDPSGNR